jgi:DNA modification methylase
MASILGTTRFFIHSIMELNKIYNENCLTGLKNLPDNSIDCCVTSPPYFGLRDYGNDEQIGLEETPELFVAKMVEVFAEVKRTLKKEGTLWLNLGDSYCHTVDSHKTKSDKQKSNKGADWDMIKRKFEGTLKTKDLIGIPWMVAFALRSSGWYLRQDIIWHKPNPMPESVTDRCTKSHEYIFLMSKSQRYYYDADAIKTDSKNPVDDIRRMEEQTWDNKNTPDKLRNVIRPKTKSTFGNRNGELNGLHSGKPYYAVEQANKRSVWTVNTMPYSEAHFATFPERLITDCIKAGCPENGIVLDPFMGAGTTALVAKKLSRNYIGFELNPAYIKIAEKRLYKEIGMFL